MSVTRLLNIAIATLWLLVLMGAFILISWQSQAAWINQLDGWVRDQYLLGPERRFELILTGYEHTDNSHIAITQLEALLQDIDDVQKGDEVSQTKRVAFGQLVLLLRRNGNLEQALNWTQRWLGFDSRDIDALLTRALLLMTRPNSLPEGELQLALLGAKFPNSLTVASGRATAYASIGQLGSAFRYYVPFINYSANPLIDSIGDLVVRDWQLKTKPTDKTWVKNNRALELSYHKGEIIDELTITFHSGMNLDIEIQETQSSQELPFLSRQLLATNNGTYLKNAGSYASLSLKDFVVKQDITIRIETRVAIPETLAKLLQSNMYPLVLAQLEQDQLEQDHFEQNKEARLIYQELYNARQP